MHFKDKFTGMMDDKKGKIVCRISFRITFTALSFLKINALSG